MTATSLIQFEDKDGNQLSGILQVPNQISTQQLQSLIGTTLNLFYNGRIITTSLEDTLTKEQLEEKEEIKKIRLCDDLPATQPALYCSSTYSGHEGAVLALRLRGRILATAGGDNTVRVWDTLTKTQCKIIKKHTHWVMCIDINDKVIVSGGMDKLVNVYSKEGEHLKTLAKHRAGVSLIQLTDNGIISCGRDGQCIVWDLNGSLIASWAHSSAIKALAVNSGVIVTGDVDGCIKVYKEKTYFCDLKGHNAQVNTIAIAGRFVVSGDDSGAIIVWKDWQLHKRLQHKREVISLSISPHEQSFVSGSFDRTVRLWSLETGEALGCYFHAAPVYKVAAFNDVVMSASQDRTVKAYKIQSKKLVSNLVADDEVYDFDYSDGMLVCGCKNGKVQFFN